MAIKSLFLVSGSQCRFAPQPPLGSVWRRYWLSELGWVGVPSTSSGWSLGMLLNILWCPRQPHNRVSGVTKNVSSAVVEQSWSYIPSWRTALSNKPSIFARTMGSFSLIPTIAESKMVTSLKVVETRFAVGLRKCRNIILPIPFPIVPHSDWPGKLFCYNPLLIWNQKKALLLF